MRSTRSPSLETQSSFERLQQLVKKEGKSARNLVTWSVPVVRTGTREAARGRRGRSSARRRPVRNVEKLSSSERMCRAAAAEHFTDSTLGGKEISSNRADIQARYWRYLFDNLFRAVDELYKTCEVDCSVIECQEVMMALDGCHRDFSALIERIEMERHLERCPESRPPGVAWEVRKTSSPSKTVLGPVKSSGSGGGGGGGGGGGRGGGGGGRGVVRRLERELSWADRVRGGVAVSDTAVKQDEETEENVGKVTIPWTEILLSSENREEDGGGNEVEEYRDSSETVGEDKSAEVVEQEEDEPEDSWSQLVKEFDEEESGRQVSWAERCESPPLDDIPLSLADTPRSPGRAITLHQRLSSPSRKRPIEESKRMLEEKLVRAQQTRDRLVEEQKLRSKAEQEKVREAREARESKKKALREEMEEKLQKAEQLREIHLQEKRRKAQDEDAKVSEIAFINSLEAQNRKMQVLQRHQGHEARLADIAEERARRREETVAREEAAQERRRVLEEERQAKLKDLDERRRDQVAKIEQMKLERERAREEAALEKARERERRLEARNTALQLSTVELEKKIQSKQDESSRRHDQQLEQIKEKAVGSRHTSCEEAPCVLPYPHRKWCTLCSVPIVSDVYLQSHERGRRHQEALSCLPDPQSSSLIITLDEEGTAAAGGEGSKVTHDQLRASRKRLRKLRQRITTRWRERESVWREAQRLSSVSVSENSHRIHKCLKEISRQLEQSITKLGLGKTGLQQLEKNLAEVCRIMSGKISANQLCFHHLGGVTVVTSTLGAVGLSAKTKLLAVSLLQLVCADQSHVSGYILAGNHFSVLVDVLVPLLPHPSSQPEIDLCSGLLSVMASILSNVSLSPSPLSIFTELMDSVSYIVSSGVVQSVSERFSAVWGPLTLPTEAQFIISAVNLLVAVSAALHDRVEDVFNEKRDDPTSLSVVLEKTELVGLLRMLYAILLHDGPPRHSSTPPPLSSYTLSISTASLRAINNFAILNLNMVQNCLGAEGISLEFRHIASYLMWQCSYHDHSELLKEIILAVGYFSVLQPDNQVFLQLGRSPTLLQLLCSLPFQYFSNPQFSALLFPTLVCACYQSHGNKDILEQEISCQLLVSFLSSHLSQIDQPLPKPGSRNLLDVCYRFPRSCWRKAIDYFSPN